MLVLLFMLPFAQSAVGAVASYVYHCCCGDHDGSGDCDCPDCPANDDGSGDASSESTSFRRCGGEARYGVAGMAIDTFTVPSMAEWVVGLQPPPAVHIVALETGPALDPLLRPPR